MIDGVKNTNPRSPFAWLLWWMIDPQTLKKQARQYKSLPFIQTSRGQGAALLLFSAVISTLLVLLSTHQMLGLIDVFLLAVLAAFVYLGHRWAIIGAMALWTLEKAIQLVSIVQAHQYWMILTTIVWWTIYMHVLYFALRVETYRHDNPEIPVTTFE